MNLFAELKRRNVIRMAAVYLVAAWLIVQVAQALLPAFEVPGWVARAVIILLALGFVPALVFSWMFELKPGGLRREPEVAVPDSTAGAAIAALPAATREPGESPSIAILPFVNLGEDAEQGFFSDGVTEDIITELSRWERLSVRSRSASFRYRGDAIDPKQVARELDVRYVVEGSIRRIGERIRIAVQLIDTGTDSHVWAEKYDLASDNLFKVQDEVVRAIVSTLAGRVHDSDVKRARRKPPSSLTPYEYVLKGNALPWDDPAGAAEATRLFEKAIEIDPGYGLAHSLLATMRIGKWREEPAGSDATLKEAYALAKRAVELSEKESTCFSLFGYMCLLTGSFDRALENVQRAIELNPNSQWNTADMGLVLAYLGRGDEALAWFRRAREIDPYFETGWYWRAMGQALLDLHRYREALTMLDHASARQLRVLALKAACHARLGEMDRARVRVAECLAVSPGFSVRQFMSKEPYKNPADAGHLAESLRMAGLPD